MTTLIIPKQREHKPYRLKCRFKADPYPSQGRLDQEKVIIAEQFVKDMHKQGWEYDGRHGLTMTGPYPMVTPITIHPRRMLTAREMASGVANGQRFRDDGEDAVSIVPRLSLSEHWEYEITGVFVREQIMVEYPDPHEEEL